MGKRVAVLFSFLCCFNALARQYGYHEGTALYLGRGFDPVDITEGYPVRCIEFDEVERLSGKGVPDSKIELKAIHSQKDLFHELGFSSEIAAQYYFASGKAGVSYVDQSKFFEDSLTWMIVGKVNYGFFGMKNPRLSAEARKLIDQGKHTEFAKACGTHLVSEEQRGERVFAIYTLHNLTHSQKTAFEAKLSVQANLWGGSGGLTAEFQNSFGQVARNSQLEFHVYATGGGGLVDLSSVVTDALDIKKVQEAVRGYMQSMTADKAVATSYVAASMARFGWEEKSLSSFAKRDWVLSDYFFLIQETKNAYDRLTNILSQRKTTYRALSDSEVANYRDIRSKRKHLLEQLFNEAGACFGNVSDCHFPDAELEPIEWPIEKVDECERLRLRAHSVGLISDQLLDELRHAGLAPFLTPGLRTIMGYVRCEELENL